MTRSSLKVAPDKEGKAGHEGTEHPGGGKSKVLITGRRRRKMLPRTQEDGSLLAHPHKGNSNPAPGNLTPHGKSPSPPAAAALLQSSSDIDIQGLQPRARGVFPDSAKYNNLIAIHKGRRCSG